MSCGVCAAPLASSRSRRTPIRRARLRFAAIAASILVVVCLLQWLGGAYRAELSGYPDEPSHFITGLMVRDYLLSGFHTTPLQFAETYYVHYPKVAFGMWPPLLHFVEAAWFVVTPATPESAVLLQAVITALLAASLISVLQPSVGWALAASMGCIFVALPPIQMFTAMVMGDGLMGLLAFWAMLAAARYEDHRYLLLFGTLAGLSMMSKSNAAALAFLPPIMLLLTRQLRRLMSRSTVLAALIALAIAGPWQFLTMVLWPRTVDPMPFSVANMLNMMKGYAVLLWTMPGPLIASAAIVGVIVKVVLPLRSGRVEPLWASATGLIAGFYVFHSVAPLPGPEPRYLTAVVAAIMLFAGAGVAALVEALAGNLPVVRLRAATAAGLILLFACTSFAVPRKPYHGYSEAARDLLARTDFHSGVVLVSSENMGEGMLVAEIAAREKRPGHVVLRGSKVLGHSKWNGNEYRLLHGNADSMMQYLSKVPVLYLVVDHKPGLQAWPHHRVLLEVLKRYPDRWRLWKRYPNTRPNSAGSDIAVYQLQHPPAQAGKIQLDMRYTLKKTLEAAN